MASLLERHKLVAVLVLAALVVLAGNQLSSILRLDYYSTGAHTSNIFAYQQSGLRADVLLLGSSHIRRGVILE